MKPRRVILADDHAMLRQGIRKILEEVPGLEVCGEAADGFELLELLKRTLPDLVVLDVAMPRIRGIEAAREIRSLYPDVRVIILSMHRSKEYLYHALGAGARGYVLKEDSDRELLDAIETVGRGEVYVSPRLALEAAEALSTLRQRGIEAARAEVLTCREREVLKLVAEGKTNKEIADLLRISVRTVHRHRENIAAKLQIHNVADLVRYSIRKGYVDVGAR
ncbi:MAG: response regulator transcription factor [Acidobacteria bacterium]|nr:response regulator transcription factor [Acidobacteriota bacterium]